MWKLYYANTSNIKQGWESLLTQVDPERRTKIQALKREKDKCSSLAVGLLLRRALEDWGLDYESLEFSRNPHGKPFIENCPEVHFSLSHSGDWVGCAISDRPIGLDIENQFRSLFQRGKESALEKVARGCFSLKEWKLFEGFSPEEKRTYFLECWTKKESFSKAKGLGLTMDFSSIDTEDIEAMFWAQWKEGYCFCVCSLEAEQEIPRKIEQVDLEGIR